MRCALVRYLLGCVSGSLVCYVCMLVPYYICFVVVMQLLHFVLSCSSYGVHFNKILVMRESIALSA